MKKGKHNKDEYTKEYIIAIVKIMISALLFFTLPLLVGYLIANIIILFIN